MRETDHIPCANGNADGGRNMGLNQTTGHGTGAPGIGGTTTGSTNAGPHSSSLANKADPRVDSDLGMFIASKSTPNITYSQFPDHSRNAGLNRTTGGYDRTTGGTTTGLTGGSTAGGTGSTTAGPHSSSLANKADPRVDSDLGELVSSAPPYCNKVDEVQTTAATRV